MKLAKSYTPSEFESDIYQMWETSGVDYETAVTVLANAKGHVKTALVMILADVDADTARHRLVQSNGFVRKALEITSV